jgi:phage terminase large subunit
MREQANKIKIQYPDKLVSLPDISSRYVVLYGGRGSSKSWSIAQTLILKSLQSQALILCAREIQNTIKDSVHRLLSDTINRLQFNKYFDIVQDEIRCKNGSRFIFKGIHHNVDNIKSLEGAKYCWIEEGQSISSESLDVIDPTIRMEGSQIYISLNPKEEDAPVYQNFILNNHPEATVIKVNYYDNPFLSNELKSLMSYCKQTDYDKYLHIWEGNVLKISEACIFKGHFEVKDFETPEKVEFKFGVDWGYANDPAVLLRSFIIDDCLYIDQEAYSVGVEIPELPQFFDQIPNCKEYVNRADSARPELISYMLNLGYPVVGAKKGPQSITAGNDYLKKFRKIYIHPRCNNTAYEFANYSYKIDKLTNKVLPIIVDKNNHCIDALRYAMEDRYSFQFTEIMQEQHTFTVGGYNPFAEALKQQEETRPVFNF